MKPQEAKFRLMHLVRDLLGYIGHKPECNLNAERRPRYTCNCGYDGVIKRAEKLIADLEASLKKEKV